MRSLSYFKSYLFQGFTMILNFFSMFLVLPALSSNIHIFGIYTSCIAFTTFLSYSDFGFLPAAQKLAMKFALKSDMKGEAEVIGFALFILLISSLFLSVGIVFLLIDPNLYLSDVTNNSDVCIARSLFAVLLISVLNFVLQKLIQMILATRYLDYKFQILNVFINSLRIIGIFYFFHAERYDIVGYFLYTQLVSLVLLLLFLAYVLGSTGMTSTLLLTSIKFNKTIYLSTKNLALSGVVSTLIWIFLYELDVIYISKNYGMTWVAFYAIGFTILAFFRGIFGMIYSPFVTRFNELIYLKNWTQIKNFYQMIVSFFSPFAIYPILLFFLNSEFFVISWVGLDYLQSVDLFRILVLVNIFAFLSYPTGMLIFSFGLLKRTLLFNVSTVILYWALVYVLFDFIGFEILAFSKLLIFCILFFYNLRFYNKFCKTRPTYLIQNVLKHHTIPATVIVALSSVFNSIFVPEQSKTNLLIFVLFFILSFVMSLILHYLLNRSFRLNVKQLVNVFNYEKTY